MLRAELDSKEKELNSLREQLNMLVGQSYMEKRRLEEEGKTKLELKEKIDDLEEMEQFNRTLMEKEWESRYELQQARKELIAGLHELGKENSNIGLKRMGELDEKIFRNACRKRFAEEEADLKALLLRSKWQDELSKPDWHPFKLVAKDQKMEDFKEIIDDADEKLVRIKAELGDEMYEAVTAALLEMNDYNPNGRCPV